MQARLRESLPADPTKVTDGVIDITTAAQQGRRYKNRQFGVVRDEAAASHQVESIHGQAKAPRDVCHHESLHGQAECVTQRGAQEQTLQSVDTTRCRHARRTIAIAGPARRWTPPAGASLPPARAPGGPLRPAKRPIPMGPVPCKAPVRLPSVWPPTCTTRQCLREPVAPPGHTPKPSNRLLPHSVLREGFGREGFGTRPGTADKCRPTGATPSGGRPSGVHGWR